MQKTKANSKRTFRRIIKLVNKNSQLGLEKFYYTYAKFIKTTARSYGCKDEDAESVINRVLVKIWQKASTLNNIKNPEGWIYVVARNCAKDELNVRWDLELNENICKSEEDYFEEIFNRDSFQYLISCLKDEEQTILSMRFVARSSFKEIAKSFDKPIATITSIYYRAVEKIQKLAKDLKIE